MAQLGRALLLTVATLVTACVGPTASETPARPFFDAARTDGWGFWRPRTATGTQAGAHEDPLAYYAA